jgi:flagellar hook-associated protein 1 FlgK
MLPKGGALVAGDRAATLSTQVDPANTGHLKVLIRSGDSSVASDLPAGALAGEMGGLLEARDGTLKAAVDGLDKLAFDFASSMNAAHATGRDLTNATGGDLFVVSAQAGAARQITVSSTVAQDPRRLATGQGGGPGDNAGVKALLGVESAALAGGDTPLDTYASIVGDFGADTRAATAAAEHDGALRGHLEQMRDSVVGVSIDEEMVLMTKAQRAYEAISRVINTSNQMLDTLLKLGNG